MKSEVPTLEPAAAYALWAATYPPHAHNPLMLAEGRAMLALLPASLRGLSVLDAGCGSGRYLRHARERHAARTVGVDLSGEMLHSAQADGLIQGRIDALPLRSDWADVTICGLTIGHLEALEASLGELRRVTRSNGMILCSDFHPIGETLGWRREFKANGQRYAVRHTAHTIEEWQHVCHDLDLRIEVLVEPRLDPNDIPTDSRFDQIALTVPVGLVLLLRPI
jgi:malonyl-CoA O-methyltransferase